MKFKLAIGGINLAGSKIEKVELEGEYSVEEIVKLLDSYAEVLPSIIDSLKKGDVI